MLIEWFGHSCFRITEGAYSVVLDPYNPKMLPKLKKYDLSANLVLASHEHDDHNYRQGVKLINKQVDNPFSIEYIDSFHDDVQGKSRGKNRITIISFNALRVIHFGDLGTTLSETDYQKMKGADAVLIPVGGFYTIDAFTAKAICDIIKPKVIIPMHYRGSNFGFKVLSTVDEFIDLFNEIPIIRYQVNSLEITKNIKNQIAVLHYQ